MAYVYEEVITKARAALKVLNKQYGVKSTLSGKGTSRIKLTISSGSIDFIVNYCENILQKNTLRDVTDVVAYVKKTDNIQVNQYYLDSSFSSTALEYLEKAKAIMYADHWDESDVMTDYFHCAFYVSIDIGSWNKPYELKN